MRPDRPLRQVLALALPSLGVLAAEPLYLLVDTAVVGNLGAVPLAGLAVAGVLLAVVASQSVFLSYATTARAARLHGAGRRADAVNEGVQATWLALSLGLLLLVVGQVVAEPITGALAGSAEVADAAVSWLRIALLGVPAILVSLAGNGWLRGIQEAGRPLRFVLVGFGLSAVLCPILVYPVGWGLVGSAVANVVGQSVAAALFLAALLRERVPLVPDLRRMRAQLVLGRDLVVRSAALQACFLSATAVAAQTSTATVAAHQVVLQLWFFLALVLDSLAIAAQSLVGEALGAGDSDRAVQLARHITGYGLVFGLLLAGSFAALPGVLPRVFTADAAVLAQIGVAWWFFVALQPVCGVVFAIDGVLMGSGDAAYLRTITLAAALLGFLPVVWASLIFGWGIAGIWTGLTAFMMARLVLGLARTRTARWAVIGAER